MSRVGARGGRGVRVGNATLQVAAIITLRAGARADYFNIAPRVLMHVADVAATGLVQTGSRVDLPLCGRRAARPSPRYEAGLRPRWRAASAWRTCATRAARCACRSSARSASSGWPRCCRVILAAVAVALGGAPLLDAPDSTARAVMRCLGATQADIFAHQRLAVLAARRRRLRRGDAGRVPVRRWSLAHWLDVLHAACRPRLRCPRVQGAVIGMVLVLGFTHSAAAAPEERAHPARAAQRCGGAPSRSSLLAYALGLGALVRAHRVAGGRPEARRDRAGRVRRVALGSAAAGAATGCPRPGARCAVIASRSRGATGWRTCAAAPAATRPGAGPRRWGSWRCCCSRWCAPTSS